MGELAELSDFTFAEQVYHCELVAVVEFWAPWCRPCLALQPEIGRLAEERPDLKVFRLNVDENPVSAMIYGVKNVPTLLVFRNGQEMARLEGFRKKEELERRIGELLGKSEKG
ncbi:MAG: thioredoxin family protein [Clostridia bacterium]|jgi:thioredoxin 1|nr:thioredoxin family protein [Clostridia bacterium]MCL6520842.1 thioredoxin family protein [Bacillota bacterium]